MRLAQREGRPPNSHQMNAGENLKHAAGGEPSEPAGQEVDLCLLNVRNREERGSRKQHDPYYFAVTVTGTRYHIMLDNYRIPQLEELQVPLQRIWFQQDGATGHTIKTTFTHLQGIFPRKFSLRAVPWPFLHGHQTCPPLPFSCGPS